MFKFFVVTILIATVELGNALLDESNNGEAVSTVSTAGIVNFAETTIETVPYQISIGYFDGPNRTYTHWCSGAIISANWAITAAHCFDHRLRPNTSALIIFSGSSDPGNTNQGSFHEIVEDRLHWWYSKSCYKNDHYTTNDIGLLRVKEPFVFGTTRQSVPLYEQDEIAVAGSHAVVSGWGQNNNPDERIQHSKVLNRFDAIILSKYDCNIQRHGDLSYGGHICTVRDPAYQDKICSSDKGGPLVINGRLAGIVSAISLPCPDPEDPAIYAEVAHFRNWIRDNTGI